MDNKDLILSEFPDFLVENNEKNHLLISKIKDNLPEIKRTREIFSRSHSDFMMNNLVVSQPTTIRSLRQIQSEIERSMMALAETFFKRKKDLVEIKIKKRQIENEQDELKRELIFIELDEKNYWLSQNESYITATLKKIYNLIEQYNHIAEKNGVKNFTEADFENDEEKYHIMTAFNQALCAARANHGLIDHGNHIYLSQIGINGSTAQALITGHLQKMNAIGSAGQNPTKENDLDFLEEMSKVFAGCSKKYMELRGQKT